MDGLVGDLQAELLPKPLLDLPIASEARRVLKAPLERFKDGRRHGALPRGGAAPTERKQLREPAAAVDLEPPPDRVRVNGQRLGRSPCVATRPDWMSTNRCRRAFRRRSLSPRSRQRKSDAGSTMEGNEGRGMAFLPKLHRFPHISKELV